MEKEEVKNCSDENSVVEELDKNTRKEIDNNECKQDEDTKNKDNINLDETNLEIIKLQNELQEITDKFYRANADFDNIKKRMQKEKEMLLEYANEKFAKELLPIIDTLEEASKIDVGDNELAIKMKEGINQCVDMLHKCFEKFGIIKIETDKEFNPEFHNAISVVENENSKSGEIVNVYQKGYKYKDRVLRASMVTIAK